MQQQYDKINYDPAAPIVSVKIKPSVADGEHTEILLTALIDSGADVTVLPEDLLIRIGAERIDKRRSRGVYGYARTVNLYLVDIQIDTLLIPSVHAIGVSSEDEPLIGRDVLNHLIVTLDGISGLAEIS
ncbi:MAG: retroviral-like aspartic protease family protein [Caldilineaceae bacterium]